MRRRDFVKISASLLATSTAHAGPPAQESGLRGSASVDSRGQLSKLHFKPNNLNDPGLHIFADNSEVYQVWGCDRRAAQPEKHPTPIIVSDQPWEIGSRIQTWGSVLRNPETGILEMYYQVYDLRHDYPSNPFATFICRATSQDGMHWEKPPLGVYDYHGSRNNNIAFLFLPPYEYGFNTCGSATVVRDEADRDAQRRYKLFGCMQDARMWADVYNSRLMNPSSPRYGKFAGITPEQIAKARAIFGIYYITSHDGIHWALPPQPIAVGYGDRVSVGHDYRTGQWVVATFARSAGLAAKGIPHIRGVVIKRSPDLSTWSDFEPPVPLDDSAGWGMLWEQHNVYPFNYGSGYLAWMEFMEHRSYTINARLLSSDDGHHWTWVAWGRPFLPSGNAGDWDDTWVTPTTNPPIEQSDELLFFYSNTRLGTTEGAIGVARLRLDGFVGLWVGSKVTQRWGGAELIPFVTSRMVEVTGPVLTVNFFPRVSDDLTGQGPDLRVSLLDSDMKEISGFGLDECIPIGQDGTRLPVHWRNNVNVAKLVGRKVHVHIRWQAGVLYAYKFGA